MLKIYRDPILLDKDLNFCFFAFIKTISQKDSSNAIKFLLDNDIYNIILDSLNVKLSHRSNTNQICKELEENFPVVIMILGNLLTGEDKYTKVLIL